jgi:CRISPR-associated protein Cmr4
VGAGSSLSAVDLPIQRERLTHYPLVQSSGLKGALREQTPDGPEKIAVFGPDTSSSDGHAGALSVGDARILLFPVRSLKGVFAYTTCLNVLQRWARDMAASDVTTPTLPAAPPSDNSGKPACYATAGTAIDQKVVLEEYVFHMMNCAELGTLADWLAKEALPESLHEYWRDRLRQHLVILPDDDFRAFTEQSTEILTRVRLSRETKTVQPGALWTEENLPVDTLLYAPVRASRLRFGKTDQFPEAWKPHAGNAEAQAEAVLDWTANEVQSRIQLGGDETVGRGSVSVRWA